ncbi:MAG: hemolysin family protein [bacterium]|nr:hemolysin family protein [bacterium]
MSQEFLALLVLIALSAFLSIAEISLSSARRIKLQVLLDNGDERAHQVLMLQNQPGHFFTVVQIGLNAIAILAGIFGEASLTPYFRSLLSLVYTGTALDTLSFVCSFLTITSIFILFADLLPKRLAIISPEQLALRVVGPMRFCIMLFKPAVWFFTTLSDWMLTLLGQPGQRVNDITSDDIHAMMDAGAEAGVLHQAEHNVIGNVFELEYRLVPSAMTTRESIIYFTLQDSEEELRQQIATYSHSKFLVCDGGIDRMVGYADSKDLLMRIISNQPLTLKDAPWLKPVLTIPDSLTLSELLTQFRASREDFAVVINEYALVVGLITLNDVMNTVMGDMVQPQQQQIVKRDDASWLVDGLTAVEDVMRVLEVEGFPDDSNYETIAGFVMYRLRKVPKLTDSVTWAGYKFEVVDIENHRIDQLLVTRLPLAGEADAKA